MNATDAPALAERLDALDRKLDLVLAEIEEVRRIRREVEELKEDLTRVGKDLFQTAVTELDQVAPFVDTGDFSALAKRLIRNVNTLNELLVQLESAREFIADATPLGRQLFSDGLAKMDELDRKGYFAMAREVQRAFDQVVANFTVEDVRLLGDNLVAILQTVKNLTQPEMLQAINNATEIYKKLDFDSMEEFTLWRAFKEVNKPEMRRGLGFLIVFLRNLSAHTPAVRPALTRATAPAP
ncbi:MAG: hypothetical protein HZA93_11635 [Verrucomicrobia bacterium]|nr:hypothetical protein [Verrucomicrobiota bacterium]